MCCVCISEIACGHRKCRALLFQVLRLNGSKFFFPETSRHHPLRRESSWETFSKPRVDISSFSSSSSFQHTHTALRRARLMPSGVEVVVENRSSLPFSPPFFSSPLLSSPLLLRPTPKRRREKRRPELKVTSLLASPSSFSWGGRRRRRRGAAKPFSPPPLSLFPFVKERRRGRRSS